jgi:hypothetical protein
MKTVVNMQSNHSISSKIEKYRKQKLFENNNRDAIICKKEILQKQRDEKEKDEKEKREEIQKKQGNKEPKTDKYRTYKKRENGIHKKNITYKSIY